MRNQDSANVYKIGNLDDQMAFIAWVLNIPSSQFDLGKDFLIESNTSFRILWKLFSSLLENTQQYTVVVENRYIDRVYRDSYYFYYSSKHFNYDRFCKRLCVFYGSFKKPFYDCTSTELQEIFVGSIVIRPILDRSISRTLLNPFYFLPKAQSCHVRLASYTITVYGKKLTVKAFPYSMQDGETTSCAEITILNLLDYYSQLYPEYHYLLPSEISALVKNDTFERTVPTTGLSYELISKVFYDVGFYPRLYSSEKIEKTKFRHILCYYIESGIPVALGLKIGEENRHSVIAIGRSAINKEKLKYELTCICGNGDVLWVCDIANAVDMYYIMDDNKMPYQLNEIISEDNLKLSLIDFEKRQLPEQFEIEYMMVPLYKRMILEAADAYDICTNILGNRVLGIQQINTEHLSIRSLGKKESPLFIRLFMASSRTFRKVRDEQFRDGNSEVRDLYNATAFPKFIWVCEITTEYFMLQKRVIGEIIIDATSSAESKTDSFIIIHYPYQIARRMPENFLIENSYGFEEIKNWSPFKCFNGNLFDNI